MNMLCRAVLCGVVTFFVAGCDLALESSQIPTTAEITPNDSMITVGDQAKLTVKVYDQNGEEMNGPPSWAPPNWWNNGDGAIEISPQGDVVAHLGSVVNITAFVADTFATARLRVNPSSVKLSVPVFYFNQVNQHTDGTVPILANRKAVLRVFPTGDEVSYFRPNVRADFYRNDAVVHTAVMPAGADELLSEVREGSLVTSYNAEIPGDVLQPGVEMVIEVDPENVIPRKAGSQTRIPEQGTLPLDIIALKNFHIVIVPTIRTADSSSVVHASWSTNLNVDTEHIQLLTKFLPIADITLEAHETLYTDANLSTFGGWLQFRQQIWVMWQTEGRKGYYYGVVRSGFPTPIGGVAYAIGWPPVSVGLDDAETFVHEVGHSMGLYHAPCGGAGGPDPNFPQSNGGIGGWGYSFGRGDLIDPNTNVRDFMSYCGPTWISDYHFGRAMRFRLRSEGGATPPGAPEKTLLLWGSMVDGGLKLEPAFLIESPPTVPGTEGPYRLEGLGPAGEVRFGFDFAPVPLGEGGAHFLFALPYDPDRDGTLERIVLSGPEGEDTLSPGSTPPMAIMRDGETGRIRAFLRDWDGRMPPDVRDRGLQVKVLLSDGIPGGVR